MTHVKWAVRVDRANLIQRKVAAIVKEADIGVSTPLFDVVSWLRPRPRALAASLAAADETPAADAAATAVNALDLLSRLTKGATTFVAFHIENDRWITHDAICYADVIARHPIGIVPTSSFVHSSPGIEQEER